MTGVSTYGRSIDQIARLKVIQGDFSLLSYQLSTGKKTNKFSGLGTDILSSKRARADVKALDTYQTNITLANSRTQQTLTALKEFRAQAENFRNFLVNFSQESPHQEGDFIRQDDPLTPLTTETTVIGLSSGKMDTDFAVMTTFASKTFGFLEDLVNRKEGDRYLFAGSNTTNKPLVNTNALDAQMGNALSNWKNEGTASTITTNDFIADLRDRSSNTNLDAFTDTVVGYNSSLSQGTAGNVYARVDANTEVDYTALGNSQGIRDILVAVSFLKNENLGPVADVYAEPYTFGDAPITEGAPGATLDEQIDSFFAVFNTVKSMVFDALGDLDKEIANLELATVRFDEAAKNTRNQKALALDIIGEVEDADMNEVAVKINSLQTTLDASYRITALMQELSLVNYI